jgi:hypothetical protein
LLRDKTPKLSLKEYFVQVKLSTLPYKGKKEISSHPWRLGASAADRAQLAAATKIVKINVSRFIFVNILFLF